MACGVKTYAACKVYVYHHHSILLEETASVPHEQDLHWSNDFVETMPQEDNEESAEQTKKLIYTQYHLSLYHIEYKTHSTPEK